MGQRDHFGEGVDADSLKLVTITSGFAGYNIWLFILCSIVARGGRFFLVAIVLNRYGDVVRAEIEKRLGLWLTVFVPMTRPGSLISTRGRRAARAKSASEAIPSPGAITPPRYSHFAEITSKVIAVPKSTTMHGPPYL